MVLIFLASAGDIKCHDMQSLQWMLRWRYGRALVWILHSDRTAICKYLQTELFQNQTDHEISQKNKMNFTLTKLDTVLSFGLPSQNTIAWVSYTTDIYFWQIWRPRGPRSADWVPGEKNQDLHVVSWMCAYMVFPQCMHAYRQTPPVSSPSSRALILSWGPHVKSWLHLNPTTF